MKDQDELWKLLWRIKEDATRKNRATDLKKYLIRDLDNINRRVTEALVRFVNADGSVTHRQEAK